MQKGYKKISPFFIPYAITNMGGALLAIDQVGALRSTWRCLRCMRNALVLCVCTTGHMMA